jgi:hypothetical protein
MSERPTPGAAASPTATAPGAVAVFGCFARDGPLLDKHLAGLDVRVYDLPAT